MVIAYYYTRDHLGSVREMTDSSGTIQARYDYDPYGRTTTITGTVPSDFQYAGMYEHTPSGLNLTWFKAYDSSAGRWLSRDPEGEGSDATLYSYVFNNSVQFIDSLGLNLEDEEEMNPADVPQRLEPAGNGDLVMKQPPPVFDEPVPKPPSAAPAPKPQPTVCPSKGPGWTKLRGSQGWKDQDGNIWKKDMLHKDHWDVSDTKGNKIKEVDFNGNQIWPGGPKNKNK